MKFHVHQIRPPFRNGSCPCKQNKRLLIITSIDIPKMKGIVKRNRLVHTFLSNPLKIRMEIYKKEVGSEVGSAIHGMSPLHLSFAWITLQFSLLVFMCFLFPFLSFQFLFLQNLWSFGFIFFSFWGNSRFLFQFPSSTASLAYMLSSLLCMFVCIHFYFLNFSFLSFCFFGSFLW